jgi:hypothetical protein
MLPLRCFFSLLVLLCIPTGVFSRRGHGDSDTDSSSGSSGSDGDGDYSDSSSTGSTTYYCQDTHFLSVGDITPTHYFNYTFIFGEPDAYTEWNGAYYQGEAFFDYEFRELPKNDTSTYYSSYFGCPAGRQTIRMLGVAWIGPQTPTPTGLRNPFSLGFKAWETNKAVENITYSYSSCDSNVDLVHLGTTVDWREYGQTSKDDKNGALDAVLLNVTRAVGNENEIEFDGVYDVTSLKSSQMIVKNDGLHVDQIHLPEEICSWNGDEGDIMIGWPTGTRVNGSLTNETLTLDVSGSVITKSGEDTTDEQVNVTFQISFTGKYDAANSSQIANIGQDQTLVNFVKATGAGTRREIPWLLTVLTVFPLIASVTAWV